MTPPGATRLVLVGGHESDDGADLVRFEALLPGAVAVGGGRRLDDAVRRRLDDDGVVVVVPMTFGRDPTMVADTAKTLRWIATKHRGAVVLAAPFGVADHLTAHLRAVAREVAAHHPQAALVIVARASNPFDDADLQRIAHLVRVHGAGLEVMATAVARDDDIASTLARLRLLGFPRSVAVPAGFARGLSLDLASPAFAGLSQHGALLGDAAVARVVTARVHDALHELAHGRDGIDDGLHADHGHGYAHSHAVGDEHGDRHHAGDHRHDDHRHAERLGTP